MQKLSKMVIMPGALKEPAPPSSISGLELKQAAFEGSTGSNMHTIMTTNSSDCVEFSTIDAPKPKSQQPKSFMNIAVGMNSWITARNKFCPLSKPESMVVVGAMADVVIQSQDQGRHHRSSVREASLKERELRDAQQIKRTRERSDALLQQFDIPKSEAMVNRMARTAGKTTLLASPRTARDIPLTPAAPTGGRRRKQWWHGVQPAQTARTGRAKMPSVSKKGSSTSRELHYIKRTAEKCDRWMDEMQKRCLNTNHSPAAINKVMGLKWRKCDPISDNPMPPQSCAPPLRTLSARRRSVDLMSNDAVFAFNKARMLDEVWSQFSDASGRKMEIIRLKRALIVRN